MSIGPVAPVSALTLTPRSATTERRPEPEPEPRTPPREAPADRVVLTTAAGGDEAPELKLSFEQLQQMVAKREPRAAAKPEAAPRAVESREPAPRAEAVARPAPDRAPATETATPDRSARSVKPTPQPTDTADRS